jgi:RimJ/RimL family protein N-acetyltransferase
MSTIRGETNVTPFDREEGTRPVDIANIHLGIRLWQERVGQNSFSNLYESQTDLNDLENYYISNGGNFFVAHTPNVAVAGFVGLRNDGEGQGSIKRLAVLPEHQSQGIGQSLVGEAVEWAQTQDFKKLMLHTNVGENARPIYEKFGFEVVGFLPEKGKYGDWVMERTFEQLSPEHAEQKKQPSLSELPYCIPATKDLDLRKTEHFDADALYTMLERDPNIKNCVSWARTVTDVTQVIPSMEHLSNSDLDGRYVLAGNRGEVVGALWAFPGEHEKEFGIGYCLDINARGKGYATKAVSTMIDRLDELGAQHIYLQIITTNNESNAIAQRLGFEPAEIVMGADFPVEQQRWRLELTNDNEAQV